jgi:hypothetical protein
MGCVSRPPDRYDHGDLLKLHFRIFLLIRKFGKYETKDVLHVGVLWLSLTLLYEWSGSCNIVDLKLVINFI